MAEVKLQSATANNLTTRSAAESIHPPSAVCGWLDMQIASAARAESTSTQDNAVQTLTGPLTMVPSRGCIYQHI